jgi:hypothetical protein
MIDMEATKQPTETSPKKDKKKQRIEKAPSLSKEKTRTHNTERKQTAKQSGDMSPSDDVTADNGNMIGMEATNNQQKPAQRKTKTKNRKGSLAIEGQNT